MSHDLRPSTTLDNQALRLSNNLRHINMFFLQHVCKHFSLSIERMLSITYHASIVLTHSMKSLSYDWNLDWNLTGGSFRFVQRRRVLATEMILEMWRPLN